MKIEKSTTTITLTEEELKSAIEYWLMVVKSLPVEINHLEHITFFGLEYDNGVELIVTDKPSELTYRR